MYVLTITIIIVIVVVVIVNYIISTILMAIMATTRIVTAAGSDNHFVGLLFVT